MRFSRSQAVYTLVATPRLSQTPTYPGLSLELDTLVQQKLQLAVKGQVKTTF